MHLLKKLQKLLKNKQLKIILLMMCYPLMTFGNEQDQKNDINKIFVIGDSLSAAYQMDERQGWVSLLQDKLKLSHPKWKVINASIAGDTTSNGLVRLPDLLKQVSKDMVSKNILIIELGANDGLMVKPLVHIKQNLKTLVKLGKDKKMIVYLIEIKIPPNLGRRYTDQFNAIFHEIVEEELIHLIPFDLEVFRSNPNLIQNDGLHPKAEAQPMIMETVFDHIKNQLD